MRCDTESDLAGYLDQKKSGWKKYKDVIVGMTLDQCWNEFFHEDAVFGYDRFQQIQGFKDIKFQPFDNKMHRIMTLVVPVVGVPLLSQTRVTKTLSVVHKSESKIMVEIVSQTIDAPYSNTFVCKEAWLLIGSQMEP